MSGAQNVWFCRYTEVSNFSKLETIANCLSIGALLISRYDGRVYEFRAGHCNCICRRGIWVEAMVLFLTMGVCQGRRLSG